MGAIFTVESRYGHNTNQMHALSLTPHNSQLSISQKPRSFRKSFLITVSLREERERGREGRLCCTKEASILSICSFRFVHAIPIQGLQDKKILVREKKRKNVGTFSFVIALLFNQRHSPPQKATLPKIILSLSLF